MFPHNQAGLIKSGLAGHTGVPDHFLGLQRQAYVGLHPGVQLNRVKE
jgi:hypothetical protein